MNAWSLKFLTLLLSFTVLIAGLARADGRVLVLGDSHICGAFGDQVVDGLAAKGSQVDRYCMESSDPIHWVNQTNPPNKTKQLKLAQKFCQFQNDEGRLIQCPNGGRPPPLGIVLGNKKYDRIILAFGTNSLLDGYVDANYAKLAEEAAKASKYGCDWIGAPHVRSEQAKGFKISTLQLEETHVAKFSESLNTVVGQHCHVRDSTTVTRQGLPAGETSDGVHRSVAQARSWSADILAQLEGQATNSNTNTRVGAPRTTRPVNANAAIFRAPAPAPGPAPAPLPAAAPAKVPDARALGISIR